MGRKKIVLSINIYPLEAILNCCYTFLDRAYIFLDSNPQGEKIQIFFKDKTHKEERFLTDEFMNELLHSVVRLNISKNNKKIREYIVGRALYGASLVPAAEESKSDETLDYLEDPLGIAIPWEEKYGKDKKRKNKV